MKDKILNLALKMQEKKLKEEQIKAKYKDLSKIKKLTQEQRIARIEESLGID